MAVTPQQPIYSFGPLQRVSSTKTPLILQSTWEVNVRQKEARTAGGEVSKLKGSGLFSGCGLLSQIYYEGISNLVRQRGFTGLGELYYCW